MGAFYYTYVLRCSDGRLYVGSTTDLRRRLGEHREGKCRSTIDRRPVALVYYEACRSDAGARSREQQLKTGFGRAYLKRRLVHEVSAGG
ncbi:MAG: GIY-YIG nuclease family protein [Verrucomicrobiota bacterium]